LNVDFIVPAYNAETTIKGCIEKILELEYGGKIKIIAINDGSSDRTLEILESLKDKRLKIINCKKNMGIAAATNKGIKSSKSHYVAVVESDAYIDKDWLDKLLPNLKDKNIAGVGGIIRCYTKTTRIARVGGYELERRYDKLSKRFTRQVSATNVIYRTKVFEEIGLFDESMIYGHENEFNQRLIRAGYKLLIDKSTGCDHQWKTNLYSYRGQQFKIAYGRLKLMMKFGNITGDEISNYNMIMQVPISLLTVLMVLLNPQMSIVLIAFMFLMNLPLPIWIISKKKDHAAAVLAPFQMILRNFVWSGAFIVWVINSIINPFKPKNLG
jgi:glycosyltransferase involved in cell wall biosynthesis